MPRHGKNIQLVWLHGKSPSQTHCQRSPYVVNHNRLVGDDIVGFHPPWLTRLLALRDSSNASHWRQLTFCHKRQSCVRQHRDARSTRSDKVSGRRFHSSPHISQLVALLGLSADSIAVIEAALMNFLLPFCLGVSMRRCYATEMAPNFMLQALDGHGHGPGTFKFNLFEKETHLKLSGRKQVACVWTTVSLTVVSLSSIITPLSFMPACNRILGFWKLTVLTWRKALAGFLWRQIWRDGHRQTKFALGGEIQTKAAWWSHCPWRHSLHHSKVHHRGPSASSSLLWTAGNW